jgi:hypothetical protein
LYMIPRGNRFVNSFLLQREKLFRFRKKMVNQWPYHNRRSRSCRRWWWSAEADNAQTE